MHRSETIRGLSLFLPEIKEGLAGNDIAGLKEILSAIHPIDLAEGWPQFGPDEKLLMFSLLDPRKAVEVFEEMDYPEQYHLIANMDDISAAADSAGGAAPAAALLAGVLNSMASDDKARLFQRLPKSAVKKMLSVMKQEKQDEVHLMMSYPPKTAGHLMNTNFIELKKNMTAKEALEKLSASLRVHRIETVQALYVTDDEHHLIGGLTLRRLLAAPQHIRMEDLMSPVALLKIKPDHNQEDVAKMFSKYDLIAAPVVDDENKIIGIISIDDIVDVIQNEATEDMAKFGGTTAEEFEAHGVLKIARVRMPWLFATFLGGLVTSVFINFHSGMLDKLVALAAFIPVVLGMGNNIGVQSATIVVRSLALGKFQMNHLAASMWKELRIGLVIGFACGVMLFVVAHVQHGSKPEYHLLGVSVGLGIWCAMTAAALIGLLMPIIFKTLKLDPAVASGPFVATATDIVSLSTYLTIASVILWHPGG